MGDAECPMCGASLEEDDEYCPDCGSKFSDDEEVEERYDEFYDGDDE